MNLRIMYFCIFDLEWNNVYSRKQNGFLNEIIEIGAVMLDSSLKVIDSFSVLVKSQLGRKLTSRVKKLTHISNEEMKSGLSFPKAIKEFCKWIDGRDCVFMSWGNTDIRTLVNNFQFFQHIEKIPFIDKYLDLQKYCQTIMNIDESNQIGLSAAALQLEIDISKFSTHRALEDCLLSRKCFKRCYDDARLPEFIMQCNDSFYKRLEFKVHNITNINNPKIDRNYLVCSCEKCNGKTLQLSEWKSVNQSFRSLFFCNECKALILCSVRFKESYDKITVIPNQKKIDIDLF